MRTYFLSALTFLVSASLFSQDLELAEKSKDCSEFYKEYCFDVKDSYEGDEEQMKLNERSMKLDGQSRGGLFNKGDTVELHMMAYKDQEYRLTLCAEETLGEEPVEFKVYHRNRELIDWKHYDDSVNSVLEEQARLDSIKQDSIFRVQDSIRQANGESSSDPYYYDNSYYEESYSDDFGGSYSDSEYSEEEYFEDDPVSITPRKRPKFHLVKKLMYDNSEEGMAPTLNFAPPENMSLIVEIVVPGEKPDNNFKLEERGCVGVLIEHTKVSKLGF